jgi:hypothetical protein
MPEPKSLGAQGKSIDPTANVIALVEANAKAAEQLRVADAKFYDAEIAHLKEVGVLRAAHAETMRLGDLDRLAATRQVDVLAASAAAAALATAVQTLGTTSDRNAETLRSTLTATAATMAKQTTDQAAVLSSQTDSLVKDINARIAELQKVSYQGGGKSEGMDSLWKILVVGAGLLLAFLTYEGRTQPPIQVIMPSATPSITTTTPVPSNSLVPR